ncbi:MAG TPA: AmmeMemoRadiSam system protein A [Nannocystaceae bacterium]|nr:AmmeMemoRadiSam system protein A [Nannocystaceae bacterium]
MTIAEPTRRWLSASAREAVAEALDRSDLVAPAGPRPDDDVLASPACVFVSWHAGAKLLGCIGTLQPHEALADAVRHYAVQAGLHDPRIGPMSHAQLGSAHAEISVLGPERELDVHGIDAIADAIVPGRDGVVLRSGWHRAVFLPVVWEKLPTAHEFLDALCRKAGIVSTSERADARASVFTVESWSD